MGETKQCPMCGAYHEEVEIDYGRGLTLKVIGCPEYPRWMGPTMLAADDMLPTEEATDGA